MFFSEADPGIEGMLIEQGKADETPDQKLEEPEDYDGEEQIAGGVDLEKKQQNKQPETIGVYTYIWWNWTHIVQRLVCEMKLHNHELLYVCYITIILLYR